jgi:hypothetical protein
VLRLLKRARNATQHRTIFATFCEAITCNENGAPSGSYLLPSSGDAGSRAALELGSVTALERPIEPEPPCPADRFAAVATRRGEQQAGLIKNASGQRRCGAVQLSSDWTPKLRRGLAITFLNERGKLKKVEKVVKEANDFETQA